MRLGLAIAAMLRAVHPASEEDDRDRYETRAPIEAPASDRAMLNWANKRTQAPASAQAGARPEPLALAGQFTRGRQEAPSQADLPPPPGERRVTYQAYAYQPFTPQTPYQTPRAPAPPTPGPSASSPALAPLPSSLYGDTPALPDPSGLAGGPPPQAERAAIAPPRRLADASAASPAGSSKLYSVHRAYGLEPDLIPEPPGGDRYVLIGPPDAPRDKPTDDGDESDVGVGRPF